MNVTELPQPELHVWLIRSTDKPDAYVMETSLNRALKTYLQRGSMSDHDNVIDVIRLYPLAYKHHKVNGKRLDLLVQERGQFAGVLL